MALFDVDFTGLVHDLLPVRMRTAVHKAWVKCLVTPVVYLYGLFTTNRGNNLYTLNHTGQVYSLEAVLNDALDATARRITIVDAVYFDPIPVYILPELIVVPLGLDSEIGSVDFTDPIPLYTDAETYVVGPQFIVRVPTAVSMATGYSEARVRGLVDRYRLPGKKSYSVVVV